MHEAHEGVEGHWTCPLPMGGILKVHQSYVRSWFLGAFAQKKHETTSYNVIYLNPSVVPSPDKKESRPFSFDIHKYRTASVTLYQLLDWSDVMNRCKISCLNCLHLLATTTNYLQSLRDKAEEGHTFVWCKCRGYKHVQIQQCKQLLIIAAMVLGGCSLSASTLATCLVCREALKPGLPGPSSKG